MLTERWPFRPERHDRRRRRARRGRPGSRPYVSASVTTSSWRTRPFRPARPARRGRRRVIGMPWTRKDLRPRPAHAVLSGSAVALFLQPRAHNPTGVERLRVRAPTSSPRPARLPDVLVSRTTMPGTSPPPRRSASGGSCRSGPCTCELLQEPRARPAARRDRRTGRAVSAVARRLLGPGWCSRHAPGGAPRPADRPGRGGAGGPRPGRRTRCARALLAACGDRGVTATAGDGINLWMTRRRPAETHMVRAGRARHRGRAGCAVPASPRCRPTTSGSPRGWSADGFDGWPACSPRPPSRTAAVAAHEPARIRAAGVEPSPPCRTGALTMTDDLLARHRAVMPGLDADLLRRAARDRLRLGPPGHRRATGAPTWTSSAAC